MKRLFPAAIAVIASVAAQDQRPVFRAGTNLVTVDAYPTKDGAFVDGLTAQDFEVFEDGKPQKIEAFDLVRAPALAADAERRDPTSVADSLAQAADPYARLFVLFLDTYTTTPEGAKRLRQPLLDFLRRTISPRDLFGVLLSDSNINDLTFGRRLETLERDLEQFWVWARASTPRTTAPEQWLENCYNLRTESGGTNDWIVSTLKHLRRLDLLFTGLEATIPVVSGIRELRTNLVLVSDGFLPKPPNTRLQQYAWGTGGAPPVGVRGGTLRVNPRPGEDRTSPNADKIACDQELLRLASLDFERRFRDLTRDAKRSNVAFFPIKAELTGGIDLRAGPAVFDDSATGTLRNLAEATGGVALVLNDLNDGFKEFLRALSGYYLLGYSSTNGKADGRYHRIDVKVKQSHVDVTARAGYVATRAASGPPPALIPVKPSAEPDSALQAALALLHNNVGAPAGGVFGAPQIFRSVGRGARTRATDLQFRRNELIHVEWARPSQPTHALAARLLGRDGRSLAVPVSVVAQSDASTTIAADCTLAPLAPGDYVIELTGKISDAPARSLVAFRIVR